MKTIHSLGWDILALASQKGLSIRHGVTANKDEFEYVEFQHYMYENLMYTVQENRLGEWHVYKLDTTTNLITTLNELSTSFHGALYNALHWFEKDRNK